MNYLFFFVSPGSLTWHASRNSSPGQAAQKDYPVQLLPNERSMQKITPFLWYAKEAEDAAKFYTSIFPNSRVVRVTAMPSESPSGPASVKIVEFGKWEQRLLHVADNRNQG
jgi:hypothetical protein